MKVIVCGDRNWNDVDIIKRELMNLDKGTIIIHGNANGADSIAGCIAQELDFEVRKYNADWFKYGKAAGPIRNIKMLNDEKPDLVLAFHKNISCSKGTLNMLRNAKKAHVKYKIISE